MKVILQRDIPKLGKGGDIVTVKDGYARNYLFPRNYAVAASGGALKEHKARAARESERDAHNATAARAGAERLRDAGITLVGKVGAGTKLFGSITAADIAEEIQKSLGVQVDRRRVGLADPIKSLGEYDVPVRLHSDVVVHVKVEVVTAEELERRKAQAAADAARLVTEPEAAPAATETASTAAE